MLVPIMEKLLKFLKNLNKKIYSFEGVDKFQNLSKNFQKAHFQIGIIMQ